MTEFEFLQHLREEGAHAHPHPPPPAPPVAEPPEPPPTFEEDIMHVARTARKLRHVIPWGFLRDVIAELKKSKKG